MQSLFAGDLDVTMSFPSGDAGPLSEGKIRILATAGSERMYEDVPSFEEVGIKGDVGFKHRVVVAPAGTPPEVIENLQAAFEALNGDKTVLKLMGILNEDIQMMFGSDYQIVREAQLAAYKELVETLE